MVVESTEQSTIKRRLLPWNRYIDRSFRWTTLVFALAIPVTHLRTGAHPRQGRASRDPSIPLGISVHFHLGSRSTALRHPVCDLWHGRLVLPGAAARRADQPGHGDFSLRLAPSWLREPISFLIELLAAIPSIVYGLWGIFVLIPVLRPVELWLRHAFSVLPVVPGARRTASACWRPASSWR